jgi:glyoxylase-like metal-dependent hydrolase (beta-lactamase superfamily II)
MVVTARWCGLLCAGDYLSNVEIPMVEAGLGDYRATLARLSPLVEAAETIVPGHGTPSSRDEALRIIEEDVDYLDALERGEEKPALPKGRDSREQRKIHAENLARV